MPLILVAPAAPIAAASAGAIAMAFVVFADAESAESADTADSAEAAVPVLSVARNMLAPGLNRPPPPLLLPVRLKLRRRLRPWLLRLPRLTGAAAGPASMGDKSSLGGSL